MIKTIAYTGEDCDTEAITYAIVVSDEHLVARGRLGPKDPVGLSRSITTYTSLVFAWGTRASSSSRTC